MLYESTYNKYFLEHSKGPWKDHMYISREGESGNHTYKYPKEYYDKYKTYKKQILDATGKTGSNNNNTKSISSYAKEVAKKFDFNPELKEKAEKYLQRFADTVEKARNNAKEIDSDDVRTGKDFAKRIENSANLSDIGKDIPASVQNLLIGPGTVINKGFNKTVPQDAKKKKDLGLSYGPGTVINKGFNRPTPLDEKNVKERFRNMRGS